MITVKNVVSEYAKITQSKLPTQLKADQFRFIRDNMDLYGEAPKITALIDAFVAELNKYAEKKSETVAKPKKVTPKTLTKNEIKAKAKRSKKTPKPKASPKTNIGKKPKVKKAPTGKAVGNIDVQLQLIRSFIPLASSEVVDKNRVLNLHKRIEKAAAELKIRKTSMYAAEIEYISKKLTEGYNSAGVSSKKASLNVAPAKLTELKELASKERVMPSVNYIKRYVNLYEKTNSDVAKKLRSDIESALKKGNIDKDDIHFAKINKIQTYLRRHIEQGANLFPNEIELQGFAGLLGYVVPPNLKKKKNSINTFNTLKGLPTGVFSATQIAKEHFDTIELKGKWKGAIGTISLPFHLLFWGEKGSGKSTLILGLAKYFATEHNLKILFIAKEEGHSFTLKEKINRLSAAVPNLYFAEKLPADKKFLNQIDVLMIDSINSIGMSNDELENLKIQYPNLSTVSLLMSYKSGDTYKGDSDFGHNAQAVFKVASGKWKAEKNRFGGNEEVDIDFE